MITFTHNTAHGNNILISKQLNLFYFYVLAVKTGSIALQKFFLYIHIYIYIFFFLLRKKVCYLGSKYFFPDLSQKTNGTTLPSFFDIFASFGVKNICALFREID